jgi:tetratricopeptide (TPR) repeat protein
LLIIIQTTFDLSHGCFAHVASMSEFPQEDEVLFDLASVFKIVDIKHDEINDKWYISLVTTDEGTNVVQAYINSAEIEANETSVDFIFARLLLQMGEYNLAHDYLNKLSTIISNENESRDLALIYYYQGLNFYREGNYSQSMTEYEKALSIQRRIFPEGHSDLGETLGGIGLLYDNTGKYELALEKHLEGLSISEKSLPKDHVHIAEALNNIGLCYDRMGKFELAIEYDIRALEMKQRLFPHDHPDIATSLNNIGLAYYNHYDFKKALIP